MNKNKRIEDFYKQWCNNTANISESTETQSAFYAGYHIAFDRMMALMKIVDMLDKLNPRHSEELDPMK